MTPRAAHDALAAFRPLTPREARTVLDNPGIGWAPGTEDEARALITAAAALPDPAEEYEDSWFDVVTDLPDARGLDRQLIDSASPGEDEAAQ